MCSWPFVAGLGVSGYIMLQVGLSVTGEPLAVLYWLPHRVWSKSQQRFVLDLLIVVRITLVQKIMTLRISHVLVQMRTSRTQVSTLPFLHANVSFYLYLEKCLTFT